MNRKPLSHNIDVGQTPTKSLISERPHESRSVDFVDHVLPLFQTPMVPSSFLSFLCRTP